MGKFVTLLLTMVHEGDLVKVAMKVQHSLLPEDLLEYCQEPTSKAHLVTLLPPHLQLGPIADVEPILDAFFVVDEETVKKHFGGQR